MFDYVVNFYPDKELRDAGQEAETEIKKFFIDVMLRRDLYQAFAEYQNTTYKEEKAKLSHEQNRYLFAVEIESHILTILDFSNMR